MPLNERQVDQLFKEINARRVASNNKGQSYLETWDVLAHLNRIFGFEGWDKEVVTCELIYEDNVTWKKDGQEKSGWDVAYRATVRLVLSDRESHAAIKISEDVATGQAQHQPNRGDAHDLAIKSAVSDALKRAAKDLGNQFGLSLYDHGSTKSVVGTSLAYDPLQEPPEVTPPEAVGTKVAALRDELLGERDAPDLSEA